MYTRSLSMILTDHLIVIHQSKLEMLLENNEINSLDMNRMTVWNFKFDYYNSLVRVWIMLKIHFL